MRDAGEQPCSSGTGRAEDVLRGRRCREGGSRWSSRLREPVKPGWGMGGSEGGGFPRRLYQCHGSGEVFPGGCIGVTVVGMFSAEAVTVLGRFFPEAVTVLGVLFPEAVTVLGEVFPSGLYQPRGRERGTPCSPPLGGAAARAEGASGRTRAPDGTGPCTAAGTGMRAASHGYGPI